MLPIRGGNDSIIREVIERDALETASDWDGVQARARPLTAELLVPRESSVLRLLDRLETHRRLFALGRDGNVDGIVTIYDLNQPAAHLLAFGMALICESDVTRTLRRSLGDDPEEAARAAERTLGKTATGIRRWRRTRNADADAHIATALTFGEKLRVLRDDGLESLARVHELAPEDLSSELREICALRNAIGHYDEAKLSDPEWTFSRMRVAQRYARRMRTLSP